MNNSSLGIILNYYFYKETSLILDVLQRIMEEFHLLLKVLEENHPNIKVKLFTFKP